MALFTPIAQQDVAVERPVELTSGVGALAGTLNSVAKSFFEYKQQSAPTPAERKDLIVQNLGLELEKAASLKDQGKDNYGMAATKALRTAVASGVEIPDSMKTMYEGITGNPYESFSYENTDKYYQEQQLNSELAQGIRTGVIMVAKSQGKTLTEDKINEAVLQQIGEKALYQSQLDIEKQKLTLGIPIDAKPIVSSIQSDYQTVFAYAKKAGEDGIVTNEELKSAQLSVNNLIATKYGSFKDNTEVAAVMDQMTKLVSDLGAGVSTDPLDIKLDAIQISLQNSGFNAATIATTRSMIKTNPQAFQQILQSQLGKEGKSFAEAVTSIWEDSATGTNVVDIFNPDARPATATTPGVNPSLIPLPAVTTNPDDYKTCVEGLGQITSSTDPTKITTDTQARNAWLTQMNLCGSAVASQSNDYILGEKLLATFAGNGVINNLEAVYKTDDINAAQTNDVLQQALSSERTRQILEISSRTSTALGGQDLILFDSKGVLQLNIPALDAVADNLAGGRQGWEDMKRLIDQAGGLEAFIKKPAAPGYDKSVAGSGMAGGRVSLDAMLGVNFNRVGKLVDNVKSIDAKLVGLQNLATKYSSATELYSSTKPKEAVTTGTTTTAPASVTSSLLDKFEGGGDYNALLGFANREGGPLAGTKVSEMTIGQLKNFADTTYANYATKELGYKATPMGRYQFVGTTLADVASRMGLPDNTVFSPEVQDSMFTFLAKEVIAGKEQAGKRGALRSTWEGLRKATDAELDTMIAEIESGKATFGTTGPTPGIKFQGVTPATRNVTPSIAVQPQEQASTAPSPEMATTTQPVPVESVAATTPALSPQEQAIRQEAEGKTAANTPIDQNVMDTIKMLSANPNDVRVFATQDELIQAYNNQELRLGSLVVINGEVKAVTQDMVGAK